jgi:hypothetical protein
MLEKHRLTYLDHLGIDNYMPTKVLSNALPSQLLPDDTLLEPVAFSTADVVSDDRQANTLSVSPDVVPAPVPVIDVVAKLLGKSVASPDEPSVVSSVETASTAAEPTVVVTDEKVDKTPATAVAPIRFSLSVWRINHDIMVIDSREPGAALPTDRLLQNILRSVGHSLAQLPPSELLRWPLFKDDSLTHPEDEARAMVQAYVSAQCAKQPLKTLLLLGEEATRFTVNIGDDSEAFYEKHKGSALLQAQWQCMALIAPSLVTMLKDPMQKRITWQALQTLVLPAL